MDGKSGESTQGEDVVGARKGKSEIEIGMRYMDAFRD